MEDSQPVLGVKVDPVDGLCFVPARSVHSYLQAEMIDPGMVV